MSVESGGDVGYQLVIVADGAWPTTEQYTTPAAMARAMARYRNLPVAVVPCREVLPVMSLAGGAMYVRLSDRQAIEVTNGRPNVIDTSYFEPESVVPDFYIGPAAFRAAVEEVEAPPKARSYDDDEIESL